MTEIPPLNPVKEEADAIAALGLTHDGRLLHRYLRRVLETVIDLESDGALRQQNGRRTLARDLMRNLDQAVDRTDSSTDPTILARASGAVAVSRARRDPRNFPRVDSFSDDAEPDGSERNPT